jgi:glycosyltransferase involved in cell wall biosynthesis
VGDVKDIVGSSGAVVPVDDADAMASAILKIASLGAAERAAIGSQCRERVVSNFSASAAAQQYRELYLSLCKQAKASAAAQERR